MRDWFGSETAYYRWLGTQGGYTTQSRYPFSRTSFFPAVELIWQVSRGFGLSAGAGYFQKTWTASSSVQYDFGDSLGRDDLRLALQRETRVVPLALTATYSFPLSQKMNINLLAGLSYHFVSFRFADDTTYSWPSAPGQPNYLDHTTTKFDSRTGTAGIQFGVGTEMALFSRLSLTVDVLYRTAEVRELKGDVEERNEVSWTGHQESNAETLRNQSLWYGKNTWDGSTYTQAVYAETKPDWLDDVRLFRFGLSGLVLRAGIKIKL